MRRSNQIPTNIAIISNVTIGSHIKAAAIQEKMIGILQR
ncbi:Uncharacterised protein [Bartonella grahamii]|uniref:Uncharacterized protein n=1 Tax=Bartonella grahamii TaxID=33045 RepID=A0A336NNE6_BARGR|nr:Uncharacterised protein [Bartonella grahamii]